MPIGACDLHRFHGRAVALDRGRCALNPVGREDQIRRCVDDQCRGFDLRGIGRGQLNGPNKIEEMVGVGPSRAPGPGRIERRLDLEAVVQSLGWRLALLCRRLPEGLLGPFGPVGVKSEDL